MASWFIVICLYVPKDLLFRKKLFRDESADLLQKALSSFNKIAGCKRANGKIPLALFRYLSSGSSGDFASCTA